jgi:hypothetical protein
MQQYIVPSGVFSLKVDMSGASGGNFNFYGTQAVGGNGANVQTVISVTGPRGPGRAAHS